MYFSTKHFIKLNSLYSLGIYFASFILKIIALFNKKIKLGVEGRSKTFEILKQHISQTDKTLWFHCASLGEYEQGLPVFQELRKDFPNHKIVLSFFSPSGYEIRKNSPIADVVVYLPLDTKKNAKRFLDFVHPELTIFVKYEIWPNLLNALKNRQLKAILISAVFRKNQSFFKWYGKYTRQALFAFEHIFTQNKSSEVLLKTIGYDSVSISGDTRFDRVTNQLQQNNTIDFLEVFKQNKRCIVIGSSWPEDEKLIIDYINKEAPSDLKFIIAPHNIKSNQIQQLKKSIKKPCVLFSEKEGISLAHYQVFIMDTIGLLSKTYCYADIAYIGGAMGTTGLHNTLEAAAFGIPIIIGDKHYNFPEAQAMIDNKGMLSVSNQQELNSALNLLIDNTVKRKAYGKNNFEYIHKNRGAVIRILAYLRE